MTLNTPSTFSSTSLFHKSQHAIAVVPQEFIAIFVALRLNAIAVMSAVQFDDDSLCMACKVSEVRPDSRLTPKMRGASRQLPQLQPQFSLRHSHIAA
jgi:hypothetical protein